jgi:antitoxin HigA-1
MSIPVTKRIKASHPGKMIMWGFLDELGITQKQLADAIGVTPGYINDIVQGKRGISALMAMKLELALGYPARMWLKLQSSWDLQEAEHQLDPLKVKVLYRAPEMPAPKMVEELQAA